MSGNQRLRRTRPLDVAKPEYSEQHEQLFRRNLELELNAIYARLEEVRMQTDKEATLTLLAHSFLHMGAVNGQ